MNVIIDAPAPLAPTENPLGPASGLPPPPPPPGNFIIVKLYLVP